MRQQGPILNRILVKPHEPAKEINGIVIPELAQERAMSGDVAAVGPTVETPEIIPGATIVFRPRAGSTIVVDDVVHFLLEETEVLSCEEMGESLATEAGVALPRAWADHLVPLPGWFFVLRDENPSMTPSGRVHLSSTFVRGIRRPMGTVVKSRAAGVEIGDRVLLGPGVSRRMIFGDRTDQFIWYVGRHAPERKVSEIHFLWPAGTEASDVVTEGSPQARWGVEEDLSHDEPRADEGLPYESGAEHD